MVIKATPRLGNPFRPSANPVPLSVRLGNPWLVAGLFLLVTVSAFEITAVFTALPTIVTELKGDAYYGAAPAAYLVASLLSVVAADAAADRFGQALPLGIGCAVFIGGLALAGSAHDAIVVVAGRLLQGLGAGSLSTVSYVAVRRAVPEQSQPTVYAIMSAGWVLPSLAAPFLAGWITDSFGWRWVFLGMIPPIAIVAVLLVSQVRAIGPPELRRTRPSRLPMAAVMALGGALVVYATTLSQVPAQVLLAVAGLALCLLSGRRLLPRGMFTGRPGVAAAIGARFCASAAFGGVDGFVPLAAERIHGVEKAIWQGFVIVGAALTWTIGQSIAARKADTMEIPRFVGRGFLLLAIGGALTSSVAFEQVPIVFTFLAWMVGGLGMGLLFNPTTVVALSSTTEEDSGEVSSQLTMSDTLGFTFTTAIGGTAVAVADRTSLSMRDALLTSFTVAIAMALIGALVISRGVREPA